MRPKNHSFGYVPLQINSMITKEISSKQRGSIFLEKLKQQSKESQKAFFKKKLAILYPTWHKKIVENLKIGAQEVVKSWYLQVSHSSRVEEEENQSLAQEVLVPGCFELPLAAKRLFEEQSVDGIIALGCLVKGETYHFDYLCKACTEGLVQVSLDFQKPIGFGVLMVENLSQAEKRSALQSRENKGKEAAEALLSMLI